MNEETITVNGTELLAQRACRMVFGEDASQGPVMPAPEPLLALLDNWPRDKVDQALDVALHLPVDFDISRELPKGHVMALQLRLCRVTVLRKGRRVGYALRTNEPGLNAIRAFNRIHERWQARIRQAH